MVSLLRADGFKGSVWAELGAAEALDAAGVVYLRDRGQGYGGGGADGLADSALSAFLRVGGDAHLYEVEPFEVHTGGELPQRVDGLSEGCSDYIDLVEAGWS